MYVKNTQFGAHIFPDFYIFFSKIIVKYHSFYYDISKVLQIKFFHLDLNWEIPFFDLSDFTCHCVFLGYLAFIQDLCFLMIFGVPFYNIPKRFKYLDVIVTVENNFILWASIVFRLLFILTKITVFFCCHEYSVNSPRLAKLDIPLYIYIYRERERKKERERKYSNKSRIRW